MDIYISVISDEPGDPLCLKCETILHPQPETIDIKLEYEPDHNDKADKIGKEIKL